ncbi:ECF transporter S component [Proteiniborus sp.]|uniref:ECF transporter S component n=1 Tax=Proteiniborus sp. TaxID=2079015 RepID=UPI00331800AF
MNKKTKTLTRTAILLAIALVFQFVKMGQLITGSGINAVLIIAAQMCGLPWAAAIGLITPFMAVVLGVTPPAMIVVVPYIVCGNVLYVLTYSLLKKRSRVVGVAVAALLKFGLLYSVVNYFLTVKPPIKAALSFPQLLTALIGGSIALIILQVMERIDKK